MRPLFCSLSIAIALVAGSATAALAVEPVDAFLEALRANQYFDEALVYLDELQTSSLVDDSVRERIGYERALTLLAAASRPGDPQLRTSQLDEASAAFEAFAAEHPDHPLAGAARNQLASVLVERGRQVLDAASDRQDQSTADEARQYFARAQQQFADAEKSIGTALGEMPRLIPPGQTELQQQKQRLSAELAQARLMRASVEFETGRTFPTGSGDAKSRFQSAAKAFGKLATDYRTRTVGLLARLWEGRSYQELGEYDQALGCYGDLIDLPDAPATRSVRAKSTRHAMECWIADGVARYQAAIDRGERWTRDSAGQNEAEDLAIRYLTALALHKQAETLPEKDPNRKRLAGSARESVQPVTRQPGEFQRPAKVLLASLSGKSSTAEAESTKTADKAAPPKNFAEGLAQAKQALETMQQAAVRLDAARAKGNQAALADAEMALNRSAAEARDLLQMAMSLRDADTPAELLLSARYYQCFLNWTIGNYYDAAVLGEYLATNFPDSLPGRQGAKIALAAWVRLYGEATGEDRAFEIEQIERVAELTFARWPDGEEAEEAALTLVNFAAASGKVERAAEFLEKISADSPRRGQAELRAGQALWSTYLQALRQPPQERPSAEDLTKLRDQARQLLMQGIERVKEKGRVDAVLATAVFSLAQIALEEDEPAKAIEWLENEKFGPLTLAKAGDPAAARQTFATETYKLAMRAYIASNPPQVEKAEEAMNALEKLAGGDDPQAGAALTATYVSLGRQLQEDLQHLREEDKTDEVERVAAGFQVFLDRLLERGAGGNLSTLNWVAETYANLAHGLEEQAGGSSSQALACYEKAARAYKLLLDAAKNDDKLKNSPDALLSIQLKLADANRGAGRYDEALQAVSDVLREKPSLLSAQVTAAAIYQARGAEDPSSYVKAIMGASPGRNGRNLIWGWAQLSRVTMAHEKFDDVFHEARLNIVESRFKYALQEKDETKRKQYLKAAVEDIRQTHTVKPDLGGADTEARYDRLLKRVQKALGQPENGLSELKKQPAGDSAAAG